MTQTLTKPLTEREAGRIKTIYRAQGIDIPYRELTGFSPEHASNQATAKANRLTPTDLARAANRIRDKEKEVST